MKVSVHTLGRRTGASMELVRTFDAPAHMGTEFLSVPEGSPMNAQLRIDAVSEGLFVSGDVTVQVRGLCVRCLEPLDGEYTATIEELFLLPEAVIRAVDEGDEDAQEMYTTDGEILDLEGPFRDAIVAEMPFQPLCSPDCKGLCPTCGIKLSEAEEGHSHDVIDPRFAMLAQLLEENEE
ncbi:MAG: YceD family protein [Ruaniaceae bacterium]|nr:YceD family protein [Ruaniaceae bacterium]